jgi:hypothetical protein
MASKLKKHYNKLLDTMCDGHTLTCEYSQLSIEELKQLYKQLLNKNKDNKNNKVAL